MSISSSIIQAAGVWNINEPVCFSVVCSPERASGSGTLRGDVSDGSVCRGLGCRGVICGEMRCCVWTLLEILIGSGLRKRCSCKSLRHCSTRGRMMPAIVPVVAGPASFISAVVRPAKALSDSAISSFFAASFLITYFTSTPAGSALIES